MADLPENSASTYNWSAGIYQLETVDPVVGGVDGIANLQAKQLALRTRNLHDRVNLKADNNSPVFTGTPEAPTPGQGTNTNQLATTAFVVAALADLVNSSPQALDTLNELAGALGNDPDFATTITNLIGTKLSKTNNLSDLSNSTTARNNLGLGALSTLSEVNYNQIGNSLKTYTNLSNGNIDLSANGGGEITLTSNTAFTFSGFQVNKNYLLIIHTNGFTPSFAEGMKHISVAGNADLDNESTFYINLLCIDNSFGSEKLLTTIMKGV